MLQEEPHVEEVVAILKVNEALCNLFKQTSLNVSVYENRGGKMGF